MVASEIQVDEQESAHGQGLVVCEVWAAKTAIKVGGEQIRVARRAEAGQGHAIGQPSTAHLAGQQKLTEALTELGPAGDSHEPDSSPPLPPTPAFARTVAHNSRVRVVATPLSGAQGFTLKTDRPPFDTVQARRLGVPPARLVLRHVLPGAAVPGVQELARSGDQLLGGVLVIEAVFAIAGTATALVEAVQNLGVPTVQALTLTLAAVACLLNLVADLVSRRPAPRTEVLRWRRDAPGATGARRAARCCRPCRVRPPSSARS